MLLQEYSAAYCEDELPGWDNLSQGYPSYVIARSRATKQSWVVMGKSRYYYVYIMTNKSDTVLYTGVTNDLKRRVYEHQQKLVSGFTQKYNVTKLVYFEVCNNVEAAILREKQIKAGSRRRKVGLINAMNE